MVATKLKECPIHSKRPKAGNGSCRLCQHVNGDLKLAKPKGQPLIHRELRNLPCISEGEILERCPGCASEYRHVRDCDVYDLCVRDVTAFPSEHPIRQRPTVRSCHDCDDYASAPIRELADLILNNPLPPGAMEREALRIVAPHGPVFGAWREHWPIQRAYYLAARHILKNPPPAPQGEGRGIVIAGGGRYWPSAYVTIRMIRHMGSKLPIQLWYFGRRGEKDQFYEDLVRPLGVECIDADEMRKSKPYRILNGFEVKMYAAVHSPFAEVLFLDADSYPVQNPDRLFDCPDYRETGAIFWPDMKEANSWTKWDFWGVEKFGPDAGFETGQYVLNKSQVWPMVNLALWYNEHSDWCYGKSTPKRDGGDYGDKGPARIAFAMARHRVSMLNMHVRWGSLSLTQLDEQGRPLFVHRCCNKFAFEKNSFSTTPQKNGGPVKNLSLPFEDVAWGYFEELERVLSRRVAA